MKQNNSYTIENLGGIIERAARCLHASIAYVSTVSESGFYNISVKDVFKIALSDISNPAVLSNLGIQPDARFAAKSSEAFGKLADAFFFAFAVRVPYLRRGCSVKDKVLLELYNACLAKGAADSGGNITESFKANMKSAKSKSPEPPFNGEWFRRWVYSGNSDSSNLAAITNHNIFLLGCMDALLPLFYSKLCEVLLAELSGGQGQ